MRRPNESFVKKSSAMPERRKREAKPCRDRRLDPRLNPIIADERRLMDLCRMHVTLTRIEPPIWRRTELFRASLAGENLSKVRIAGDSP